MKVLRSSILVILLVNCLFFLSLKNRQFPQFEAQTIEGKLCSNTDFKGQKTLVVLGHLGCPAMMQLLKDLQLSDLDSSYQTFIFLENTIEQVKAFNSDEVNDWSMTRKYFKLMPLDGSVVAECSNESIRYKGNAKVIDSQCRKLSKKLRTKSSPSVYIVDSHGMIVKAQKWYYAGLDIESRLSLLFEAVH